MKIQCRKCRLWKNTDKFRRWRINNTCEKCQEKEWEEEIENEKILLNKK